MANTTKINGKTIQIDRSGVGHSWRPVTSDDSHDTTPDIIEEIAAEIDGGTLPDLVLPETIDAVDQPHPDFGGWQNFIRNHTELRDEHDGVRFFGETNCNYILFPSGLLIQNFGFNGRALMNAVREKGINTVETELRASRLELKTAVANLFARERQAARDLRALASSGNTSW